MVQGGVIFDSSSIVLGSKIAYPFLEAIMEKAELIELFRQSLRKLFFFIIETKDTNNLADTLTFTKWLS